MTDKATHSPSPSLYEKIERYGAYRFAHGHNEANRHYDIADREKANAAAMLSEILAEVERLAAQAAPTEAEYNPLLIDGVQHDPLCLKVYRSPLKECDCGASSRAAQPSQAPVVLAVQPEYCTACDMTSNDKQRCEDCPRRASSGATTQAVRMLTRDELNDVALSEQVGWGPGEYVEAIQRKFCEVNKLRIPADGVIGGV